MKELITVIINVYNQEKYIAKCLESIINQTYRNLEILIINDGSTDNTLKICENYKDERIRIITTNNMGLSMSRNVGIENAQGEYLYFVDSDDYVELDVIEYLYNMIKKYNVSISTCDALEIYNYDFKVKNKKEKIQVVSNKEILTRILLSLDRSGTTWNKLSKKELYNKNKFQDRIVNDVVVTYKIALECDKIAYSNQIKYYYFRHSDSIMGKQKIDREMDMYKAALERYLYIKNIYPKLKENEASFLLMIITLYCHNNKNVNMFLKNEGALKLYKKIFSFKYLKAKIKKKEKIKLILFRINPKFCSFLMNKYLKLKRKNK